ncbi:MAG: phosphatidate cytidylyltransferase [Clostridia bacterium]|nr:phosphatidate cytidylyltransferase [Clostridia bacterium]
MSRGEALNRYSRKAKPEHASRIGLNTFFTGTCTGGSGSTGGGASYAGTDGIHSQSCFVRLRTRPFSSIQSPGLTIHVKTPPRSGRSTFSVTSPFLNLAIGLVGAVFGQLGDLAASRIKRAIGVKDYGKIFPGHGGIMDRLDSITFSLVIVTVAMLCIFGF